MISGVAGRFGRDFDISEFADLSDAAYEAFEPTRWPVAAARQGGRFFADGRFYHADGKARFVDVRWKPPATPSGPRYPFRLNTGRLRDQWHTMTRTALSPRLAAHLPEPFLEIHPDDADDLGLQPADLVQLHNSHGRAILRARITDTVQSGQVFASMHWTGETAPSGRIDALVAAATDPISGQPESKASVVAVQRFSAAWYGFTVSSAPISPDCEYWALARTTAGYRAELAGTTPVEDWEAEARRLFGNPRGQVSSIIDAGRGTARIAFHDAGRLRAALFVSNAPVAVMRDYLVSRPGSDAPDILTGRPPADVPDPGPVLCSCFGVGINTIVEAIETGGLMSVETVGEALQAGTNCGSCRPEIAALLNRPRIREAAE